MVRFVTVTELKKLATAMVTEVEAKHSDIVITRNGKPVAILQRILEKDFALLKKRTA